MTSFKIFFPDETIRRFRCESFPSFDEFVRLMTNLYPKAYHPEMKMLYVDSDGDKCTITTQLEWEEMKKELGEQSVYRVSVAEGDSSNYFKDGPAPELIKVYEDVVTQAPIAPEPDATGLPLHERVSQALGNLFPGGKILPHNLPSYLDGVVRIRTRDDKSVDLDVDVHSLASALHRRAYNLLGNATSNAALNEAKACLLSQLALVPDNCVAYYNLACTESLLSNLKGALGALKKSVELGYHDFEHMVTDSDLANLFKEPEFVEITELAKSFAQPEVKEEKPVEVQPEPEPEKPVEVQPEPEVPQAPKKWEGELKVLAEMGFLDESILIQTLDKTGGNVSEALSDLLG